MSFFPPSNEDEKMDMAEGPSAVDPTACEHRHGWMIRASHSGHVGRVCSDCWTELPMGEPHVLAVDDMIARDHFEPEANPFDKRLRDLAEKAITQGKAEAGVKALEPIAEPKVDTTGQRNLGKQF